MPLHDLFDAQRIAILVEPCSRAAVLDAAARLLAGASPAMTQTLGERLRQREQLASTAIGHGVAIPHARIPGIDSSRGAFLRLSHPVDFNAADGQPVDLLLALAVPEHQVQQHLETLADLAEKFADPAYRAQLRAAPSIELLRRCLDGDPAPSTPKASA